MKYTLAFLMGLGLVGCGPSTPPTYLHTGPIHVFGCQDNARRLDVQNKKYVFQVIKFNGHMVPNCDTWNQYIWYDITTIKVGEEEVQFVNAQAVE